MSEQPYRPKVTQTKPDTVKRVNNQFVNTDSYQPLGGLTSASKWGKANPSLGLEKGGPQSVKGKPI